MYFLQNLFIWIRKNIIRILLKEYPNFYLDPSTIQERKPGKLINLISSTDNLWVSKSMFRRWKIYSQKKDISLNIYSNTQVNSFMIENFKDDLIYEIFKKSIIPVQKIDIFRICLIFKFGGIWLDLKSEVNFKKVLELYKQSQDNGILLS